MPERWLVTGALGCIGAWTITTLIGDGDEVVGFDLGEDTRRLELVMTPDAFRRVMLERADITDLAVVERVLDEHEITRVVHLAALQVPFCRADPVAGARVNVVGTVNVFEAVKRRRKKIPGVVWASSTAVYSADDPAPAPESGGHHPATHYGVYKLANEGTARVYWADDGIPSIGLRPYVVYGAGRDQGMTSTPTQAMAAAARGEGFEITYGGVAQYDYAPDVARAFVLAGRAQRDGAEVFNFPGVVAPMSEVVAAIEAAAPEVAGRIAWVETALPFPERLEATGLERALGPLPRTSLADGVRQTVELLRKRQPRGEAS
ncbi:MAG: NAD(P)-dependent oxidoreductase [Actinobacteria bacterium]|nr:MAG: NAD(P)-dependent oxidoreductase [Actinomycetota bacterium]